MQPEATHVAVRDGRILSVGSLERMREWGAFDLDERFADRVLMPGLVEGHCHLKEGSMWDLPYLGWFDRRDPAGKVWPGLRSMDAVVTRLVEVDAQMQAAGRAGSEPLIAWGFDPIYFGGERMTVEHLDRASRARPIVIGHANGHLMNVNSAMLKLAEITRDNEVEGVVRFASGLQAGEPNGELQEPAAMYLVMRKIGNAGLLGPMSEAGVRSFARLASMQGVTTATDLVNKLGEHDCSVLEAATAGGDCCVRILPAFQAFQGTHGAAQGAEHVAALMKRNTDRLRYGLVKMMLDGSIQGFSARLRWPGHFNGAPNGIWVMSPAQYEADFEAYHRAGLTIHTHTNGDEASLAAIDAIERVLARAPRPDHRHTLQHGQMIDAPMFRRMARARPVGQSVRQPSLVLGRPALRDDDGPGSRPAPRCLRLGAGRRRAAGHPLRRAGDAARAAARGLVRRQPRHAEGSRSRRSRASHRHAGAARHHARPGVDAEARP